MGIASVQTILAVDDDETVLAGYVRGFTVSARVFAATTISDAVVIAAEQSLDLAVVDLRIGDSSGIELVRELRRRQPNIVIVILSGYLSVALAVSAIRAGADHTLFKPMSCTEILRTISVEPAAIDSTPDPTPTLARAEWEHITRVLSDCNGNVSLAARRLGIFRQSLQRRLRKYAPRV